MDSKVSILKLELEALNKEFSDLTDSVNLRRCQLSGLREEILDLDSMKHDLRGTKALLGVDISDLSNSIKSQKLKLWRNNQTFCSDASSSKTAEVLTHKP